MSAPGGRGRARAADNSPGPSAVYPRPMIRSVAYPLVTSVLLACLSYGTAAAQYPEQVSEEQVKLEAKLIEAAGLALKGDVREAMERYGELLRDDPANAAAAYSLARLHVGEGDTDKAVELFRQARRAEPDNDYVLEALAETQLAAEDYRGAAEAYGELFARHPKRESFLLRQSEAFASGGRPADGIKAINAFLARGGRLTPRLGQQRFTLAVSLNDPKLAVRSLEELMAAFPTDPDYYQELAQFYRRTGSEGAAQSIWREMAERFPEDERAALGLAGQSKLTDEETDFLARLMPLFSDGDIAIDNKVLQLIPIVQEVVDRGDTVLANRVLPLSRKLTEVHPDEAKAFAIHGDLLLSADRPTEAAAAYAQTVQLDPGVYIVWEQYLAALASTGATEEMLDVSEEALALFPNQARLYLYNGRALARLGDFQPAVNTLQQGGMLAMRDRVLAYEFADALSEIELQRGNFDEALAATERALEIRPDHGPALARRGEIELRAGRTAAAEESIAQAMSAAPEHPYVLTVEALTTLTETESPRARGRLAAAAKVAGERLAIYHEVLGDAQWIGGDVAAAKASWERAQSMGGGSHLLETKLAQGVYVK